MRDKINTTLAGVCNRDTYEIFNGRANANIRLPARIEAPIPSLSRAIVRERESHRRSRRKRRKDAETGDRRELQGPVITRAIPGTRFPIKYRGGAVLRLEGGWDLDIERATACTYRAGARRGPTDDVFALQFNPDVKIATANIGWADAPGRSIGGTAIKSRRRRRQVTRNTDVPGACASGAREIEGNRAIPPAKGRLRWPSG